MRYLILEVDNLRWLVTKSDFWKDINIINCFYPDINDLNLLLLNKFIRSLLRDQKYNYLPSLNNTDIHQIIDNGRTIVYKFEKSFVIVVDLLHKYNLDLKQMIREKTLTELL